LATLFVLQGPDKGRTLRTDEDEVLIGRGSAQIPLTDQTVSRRHAELRASDHGWTLADLNSANGTYVNGVRIAKPVRLKHGDQIRVGSTLLVYAGDEAIQKFSGGNIPTDLVTLDAGSLSVDASIVASVPSSEDSVVMAAPETAYAVKAWNVMRELNAVIGSLLPSDQLLARVLDIIFEEVPVDRGLVFVRDEKTGEFLPEVVRFRGHGEREEQDEKSIIASRTIINHVVSTREGVLCSNVVADKRFQSGKSVQNLGMRSVICVPILAREQVVGLIHLDCLVTRHTYSEHELRLLTAIGYQAGLAIENARLVQAALERERLAAAGETVAYLSHYIKNILQGMRSGADVLQRGLDRRDFSVTGQGWRIVEKNLDKSYNLMLNMLAFSKERQPRLERLQVNRIVDEVVGLLQKQADDSGVVLLTDLDDAIPPIPVDADGIHQVVLNLVTNAIDAVPRDSGIINVRTRYEPELRHVVITVADNGPGVPEGLKEKVFDAFFSTKGHAGTGLGLAVARKIVVELGGRLELRDARGGGAEFQVFLPATERTAAGDTLGPVR
jgi:signal transduction histidine kinase